MRRTHSYAWLLCITLLLVAFFTPSRCLAQEMVKLHLYNNLDPSSKVTQSNSTWPKYPSDLQDKASFAGKATFDLSFVQNHIKLLTMDGGSPDFALFSLPTPITLAEIRAVYLLINSFNTFYSGHTVGNVELIFSDGSTLTSTTFPPLQLIVGETIGDIWAEAVLGMPRCTDISSEYAQEVWSDGISFLNMLTLEVGDEAHYSPADWLVYSQKLVKQIKVSTKYMKQPVGSLFVYGGVRLMGITVATAPLTASFTYSPELPMVGGRIEFDASRSQGNIVTYEWDFGDGQSDNGEVVQHVFYSAKTYTITLTVADADNTEDSYSQELSLDLTKGDLLFRRGELSFFPFSEWTHVGIYAGNDQVVEAWPNGVLLRHISLWCFPDMTYVCVRRVNTGENIREGAVNFASNQLGKEFDWNIAAKQTYGDTWYCSELAWAAYSVASGGPIDLDSSPLVPGVTVDDLVYSPSTELIGEHKEFRPTSGYVTVVNPFVAVVVFSPVDLVLTDPDGLTLNKQGCSIPGGTYHEVRVDDDDDLDDLLSIPEPKSGVYSIQLVAEPGALPTDTYTLLAIGDGTSITLAEDVPVAAIPTGPYMVRVSPDGPPVDVTHATAVPISIDVYPGRTPNQIYLAKNYTIYVGVLGSSTFSVSDLASATVKFGHSGTEAKPVRAPTIRDLNGDGRNDALYGFMTYDCQFKMGDAKGVLTGQTAAGASVTGNDSVVVFLF